VSVARMATVKPHGWVHASLERVRMGTSFTYWSEVDNQIFLILQERWDRLNLVQSKFLSL
jgi:hypothetical protein